jgi:hypothetical protein
LKKLMTSSTISVANLAALVKKDQTSSMSEVTRSERAEIMDDMLCFDVVLSDFVR